MIRALILFSNLILALIANVIFGEGVKVTQNSPDRVDPESEFEIELIINKTDVSGFAKIVQELPEGFEAEAIETQGASFTYNDNKVKLIWMALPQADEFSIKYKVTLSPEVEGTKILSGKFSYLYNNERKTVELPTNEIIVGYEEVVEEVTEEVEEPIEESENISEEAITEETTDVNTSEEATLTEETEINAEESSKNIIDQEEPNTNEITAETSEKSAIPNLPDVNATRKVQDMGDGTYSISIAISQSQITGFAKVQEQLPSGCTFAKGNITKNAIFSYVDQQAKFVWMSIPEDDPIEISYTVTASNVNIEDIRNMDGTFAYIFNDETSKAKITPSDSQPDAVESEPIVENNETEEVLPSEEQNPISEEITEEVIETPQDEPFEEVAEEKEIEPTQEPTTSIDESLPAPTPTPTIPTPQDGILYKVQICAGHEMVDVDPYFKAAFSFSEGPIVIENHEGWIKYTIGGFGEYKTARNRRNEVTAGYELPGPFVSAYNDGIRITVQEALMISNQNWIQ